jgi:glycine oxidase
MPHVAIVGAGLAGRLLAWRLATNGWRISLFDARPMGDTSAASHIAAAMLSPLAELATSDHTVLALAQRSMALWPQWLAQLQTQTRQSIYARFNGTLVLAHPPDQAHLSHFQTLLSQKVPPEQRHQIQVLDRHQIDHTEPALAGRFQQGLLLLGEGQLANDQLLAALQTALTGQPVAWYANCPVHTLGAHAVHTAQGIQEADTVVDTRGTGACPDLPELRGVRGEIITVQCPDVTLHHPVRLMHPRYQLYIAPRPQQRFVVGATELESQDHGPVTVRSVLELASALYSLHPAFGEARIVHMAAALRPAFDHHQPTLTHAQGVWRLNGLYRHGYLCAPALVDDLVGQLVSSNP